MIAFRPSYLHILFLYQVYICCCCFFVWGIYCPIKVVLWNEVNYSSRFLLRPAHVDRTRCNRKPCLESWESPSLNGHLISRHSGLTIPSKITCLLPHYLYSCMAESMNFLKVSERCEYNFPPLVFVICE